MTDEPLTEQRNAAPPHGEEIHLPGPSLHPILLTLGITLVLIGVLESWAVAIAGVILTVWVIVAWIRAAVREMGELPAEPH